MGDRSAIEWCDASWPIVNGCARVSPGCENCTPEARWKRMRDWAARQIRIDPSELLPSKEPDAE